MVSFPLGLLGGNTTYKHLTAMAHMLWLWNPCWLHEALQTETCGCWKSQVPFSAGGMVVKHRATSSGLAGVVGAPCDMGTATGGWRLQNGRIPISQQRFLLCLVLSVTRWDRGLKIPIERRNIEFQNTEEQPNSMKRVYIIYVLSKHNGYCTTSFLHSACAHAG